MIETIMSYLFQIPSTSIMTAVKNTDRLVTDTALSESPIMSPTAKYTDPGIIAKMENATNMTAPSL